MSRRRRSPGPPAWWSPDLPARQVLLGLAATPGPLPAVTAARLAQGEHPASLLRPDSPDPASMAERLGALGLRFLLPEDPGWPFASVAPDPPCAWLFVAGQDPPRIEESVAVVGGRRASALRRATARSLAAGLASAGLCVVSGGAVGVDTAAHAGTLDGGGRTVVVLGCGLDVLYPRGNSALFARVRAAGGTLLGEHPPGTLPLAANFLPRNRLIAALSAAVVVVEAASGSGSLSTARAAGSRGVGRVLAVPGAPWDPGAAGCNDLIRDGATLVRGLSDVLEELGITGCDAPSAPPDQARRAGRPDPRAAQPWPPNASPSARKVLRALSEGQALGPGRLAALTGLAPPTVATALLELELAGLVRRSAAGAEAVAASHAPFSPAAQSPKPRGLPNGPAHGPGGGSRAPPRCYRPQAPRSPPRSPTSREAHRSGKPHRSGHRLFRGPRVLVPAQDPGSRSPSWSRLRCPGRVPAGIPNRRGPPAKVPAGFRTSRGSAPAEVPARSQPKISNRRGSTRPGCLR